MKGPSEVWQGKISKIKNEIIYKSAHISPSGQNGMWPKEKNDKLPNITGTLTNIITSLAIFKSLLLNSYIIIKQLLDITHNEPLNNHQYQAKLYFQ